MSDDEEPRKIRIRSVQLICLADIFDTLMADLLRLPDQASWQQYVAAWKELLKKYLGIAPNADIDGDRVTPMQRFSKSWIDSPVWTACAIASRATILAIPFNTGSNAPA